MPDEIQEFLTHKIWAVVGVSSNREKYGYKVYAQLIKKGYQVLAVNPHLQKIDGRPCYPTLASLPLKPEAVSIVVPPRVTEQIVRECIRLGIPRIWMQPGAESSSAVQAAREHGIKVVYNQCILVATAAEQ